MMKNKINAVLLPFQNQLYLLPISALIEVLPTFSCLPLKQKSAMPNFMLGKVQWREISLPLVGINLKPVNVAELRRPRVAVMNALFSTDKYPPYFAVLFEQAPIRITIKENEIQWQDENRSSVKGLQHFTAKKEIILLDLKELSIKIEEYCLSNLPKSGI